MLTDEWSRVTYYGIIEKYVTRLRTGRKEISISQTRAAERPHQETTLEKVQDCMYKVKQK